MNHLQRHSLTPALLASLALAAGAGTEYEIRVHGEVEYNSISSGPFGAISSGEKVTLSFRVDEDVFLDSPNFPTRGYSIDESSWSLAFESGVAPLQNPYSGFHPMFVIRDNDPAVDGFLVSDNVDVPVPVPLGANGVFGPFAQQFYVTYGGDELPSLDIADAVGSYDFTGLTVFNWTIDDGPFNPLGMVFEDMSIVEVLPGATQGLGCGVNPAGSLGVLSGAPEIGELLTFGVDNPLGTQGAGSLPVVFVGFAPDPAYPCGTPLPGFGMAGPGAAGELLLSPFAPNLTLSGAPWAGSGTPAPVALPLPFVPGLVGISVYVQGALLDFVAAQGVPVGLTEGVEVLIGFGS